MTEPILHVVFNPSAAGDLRRALALAGRDDEVVSLFDMLNLGPINPSDPETRSRWFEEELGITDWDEVATRTNAVLEASHREGRRPVAWFSKRCALDYANFLAWLWHCGDLDCDVVDLTETMVRPPRPRGEPKSEQLVLSLAQVPAGQIVEYALLDLPRPLSPAEREGFRQQWSRLRAENAPLRITTGTELISSPISHFDAALKERADTTWVSAATVVGSLLDAFEAGRLRQVGDLFLLARLEELVDSGELLSRGNPADIRRWMIRLP